MSGEDRVEKAKFDLGGPVAGDTDIDQGDLPWSYGEDRVTALVIDPDSAYVYWELTDEALGGARARLGPSGAQGWCNLRVYDVTGRDFDGTNASSYFDVRVERNDRDHFLNLRRPGSTATVEIGVKTTEGYFQAIVRSGRADFPRAAPSPGGAVEWREVAGPAPGAIPPCVAPYRSRFAGPAPVVTVAGGVSSGAGPGRVAGAGHPAGAPGTQGATGTPDADDASDRPRLPLDAGVEWSFSGSHAWPFGSSWSGRPGSPGAGKPSGRG
ncbi:MAG: DUF4912 domain-containing protein [Polyangiaceae bacterium]